MFSHLFLNLLLVRSWYAPGCEHGRRLTPPADVGATHADSAAGALVYLYVVTQRVWVSSACLCAGGWPGNKISQPLGDRIALHA